MSDELDQFIAKMAYRKVALDGIDAQMATRGVDVAALKGSMSEAPAAGPQPPSGSSKGRGGIIV